MSVHDQQCPIQLAFSEWMVNAPITTSLLWVNDEHTYYKECSDGFSGHTLLKVKLV